jgi:hypothetical protein
VLLVADLVGVGEAQHGGLVSREGVDRRLVAASLAGLELNDL